MHGEIWRSIPSLPEYLASSEGRIMRLPYIGDMPKGGERHRGGTPHFGTWDKEEGRFVFVFRGKTYRIGRLICEAFHGPASIRTPVCMHLDENAANNRASNLCWGTQKENLNMPKVKEYHRSRTGENNPYVKGLKARKVSP
jgi:hypothetical protein